MALFGRQRPLHQILGGGKVADVVIWRDKRISAFVLMGGTLIWFLFEVAEYNLLTLLCHISITAMLLVFIWSNAAALMDGPPPKIPEVILSENAFKEAAQAIHAKSNQLMLILHDVACGKDLKRFLVVIGSLWIISVIGSCCSAVNLLYLGFLCSLTLPALYEHHENEVDHLAGEGIHRLKMLYGKLDSMVLGKIPRGSAGEEKEF